MAMDVNESAEEMDNVEDFYRSLLDSYEEGQ